MPLANNWLQSACTHKRVWIGYKCLNGWIRQKYARLEADML